MTLDEFWALVDKSRKGAEAGTDEQADKLTDLLAALPPDDVVAFMQHFYELRNEAYRWDLWAVAFIINGGCSDDGFLDFRAWLIAKGRKFFEAALAKPEDAAKGVGAGQECEFESFAYSAPKAYEKATGLDFPDDRLDLSGILENPAGTPWEEEDLPKLFPKLCKKFDM